MICPFLFQGIQLVPEQADQDFGRFLQFGWNDFKQVFDLIQRLGYRFTGIQFVEVSRDFMHADVRGYSTHAVIHLRYRRLVQLPIINGLTGASIQPLSLLQS